jgi:hypothetical protein
VHTWIYIFGHVELHMFTRGIKFSHVNLHFCACGFICGSTSWFTFLHKLQFCTRGTTRLSTHGFTFCTLGIARVSTCEIIFFHMWNYKSVHVDIFFTLVNTCLHTCIYIFANKITFVCTCGYIFCTRRIARLSTRECTLLHTWNYECEQRWNFILVNV